MYNPDKEYVRFIFRWHHTLLPLVVSDPIFWVLEIMHVGLLFTQRSLHEAGKEGLPELDWQAALVPTSLLTFFVVFYVSNCYARFYELFGCCVGISGCMAEWAYLISTHFGTLSADDRWNMMRTMLAAMHVHYAFLGGEDYSSGDAKAITEAEWTEIRTHNFLSQSEIEQIAHCTHTTRFFLPVVWGLREVKASLLTKLKSRTKEAINDIDLLCDPGLMLVYGSFETVALTFRKNCSQTLEILHMPVPFAYFHATKLLLLSALAIVSYSLVEIELSAGYGNWNIVISITVFTVIAGIMIGLQAIAVRMSDPFGDDDTDFPIDLMLSNAYNNAIEMLLDERGGMSGKIPSDMQNPLLESGSMKRRWSNLTDGHAPPPNNAPVASSSQKAPITILGGAASAISSKYTELTAYSTPFAA